MIIAAFATLLTFLGATFTKKMAFGITTTVAMGTITVLFTGLLWFTIDSLTLPALNQYVAVGLAALPETTIVYIGVIISSKIYVWAYSAKMAALKEMNRA